MDQMLQPMNELHQQFATQLQHVAALQVNNDVTKVLADDTIPIRMQFIEKYRRSKRIKGDITFPPPFPLLEPVLNYGRESGCPWW